MEELQGDVTSMKPVKAIQCSLYELNIPHRHQIRGFSLSQYSCPVGTQRVISLLKTLLSRLHTGGPLQARGQSLMDQVHMLCLAISALISLVHVL
jgi:hypothetical protein